MHAYLSFFHFFIIYAPHREIWFSFIFISIVTQEEVQQ